jgi:hypothetical protein
MIHDVSRIIRSGTDEEKAALKQALREAFDFSVLGEVRALCVPQLEAVRFEDTPEVQEVNYAAQAG